MSEKEIVISAKSLEDGREEASSRMGVDENRLGFEELESGGVMKLLSNKKKFRFYISNERVQEGEDKSPEEILKDILSYIGIEVGIRIEKRDNEELLIIDAGKYDALLIGKKGRTLDAIQHILARIHNGKKTSENRVVVDVNGYRKKREDRLGFRAISVSKQVLRTGNEAISFPMSASERKIVHQKINEIDGVSSFALGTGFLKRVVIAAVDDGHIRRGRLRTPR